MSLTYYHLSNLMKVEQMLMVTIKPLSHQFFPLKKGTKTTKKITQKAGWEKFSILISEFFFFPV